MLTNYHTHTTFCDGKNTAEEVVLYAIQKGFSAIGFSGHAYTPYDVRYCMTDTDGYKKEIRRLQEKYKKDIQIYLGTEEDIFAPIEDRSSYDYVISSSHYVQKDRKCYPFDSNYPFNEKARALFDNDVIAFAKSYYSAFCDYIERYKPDVIGHFDLPTKFDETQKNLFLSNEKYWELAEKAVKKAVESGCLIEVNTGLMARNLRSVPCPHPRLLKIIYEMGGKVVLSSDAHFMEKLNAHFEEVKTLLKEIGFTHTYVLYDGVWQPQKI